MEELIKKYPLAFRAANGIIWDLIECGDGWSDLLEAPLSYMHHYNQKVNEEDMIKVDQIKEKFGSLRFYTNFTNKDLEALIDEAEKLSVKTCETCGKEGKLRSRSWLYTACEEHTKKGDL